MATYNVLTAVVELVEASSEAEAIVILETRLRMHGFDTYEGQKSTAFESDV